MKFTAKQALAGTRTQFDVDRDTLDVALDKAEAAIKKAVHNGVAETYVDISELQISDGCTSDVLDVLSGLGFSCSASTRSMVYATLYVSWAKPNTYRN